MLNNRKIGFIIINAITLGLALSYEACLVMKNGTIVTKKERASSDDRHPRSTPANTSTSRNTKFRPLPFSQDALIFDAQHIPSQDY
jgi:hypothetical protein